MDRCVTTDQIEFGQYGEVFFAHLGRASVKVLVALKR
jgi:hypothetical protein